MSTELPSSRRQPTDVIGQTHTVRVECGCKTCQRNAVFLGLTAPLVAYLTPVGAARLGVTRANASTPSIVHGTVEVAHHPMFGPMQRVAIPSVGA